MPTRLHPIVSFLLSTMLLSPLPVGAIDGFLCRPVPDRINYTFHDPDYPYQGLFLHTGLDFDAGVGRHILAAADGKVVGIKRPKTTDYAYIILRHHSQISTLYGHISKAYVHNGDQVLAGQLLALSGGVPGSNGAGSYTTGAHLHFEVRQQGIPVRPKPYWIQRHDNTCSEL